GPAGPSANWASPPPYLAIIASRSVSGVLSARKAARNRRHRPSGIRTRLRRTSGRRSGGSSKSSSSIISAPLPRHPTLACGPAGSIRGRSMNGAAEGFREEEQAHDQRQQRNSDRIPETIIDVPRRGDHRKGGRGQKAAEPAIADMIGKRHRRVADAARKKFNEKRRDRAINHRHEENEPEEDRNDARLVDRIGIGGRRIARRSGCGGKLAAKGLGGIAARLFRQPPRLGGNELARADPDMRGRARDTLARHAGIADPGLGERGLRDVAAGALERVPAHRVELERTD